MMHLEWTLRSRNLGAQRHAKPSARRSDLCVGGCDVTRRMLSDPADTQRARGRKSGCVNRDSLESGDNEMFRGSIEAGGSPSWEEAQRGDREETDRISGAEVPAHGKSGQLAEGTNRRWGSWQPRFLAGGRAYARAQISSN